jgi:hypothetical protein
MRLDSISILLSEYLDMFQGREEFTYIQNHPSPRLSAKHRRSTSRAELMRILPTAEAIRGEIILTALYYFIVGFFILHHHEKIALLATDAAVAFKDLIDLGDFGFVDKGFAVAAATVGLEILRGVCHSWSGDK